MNPAAALAILKKIWPYLAAVVVVLLLAYISVRVYEGVKESGRVEGRAEVQSKWNADKTKQAEETTKQIRAAVELERSNFATIQAEKEKGDAERAKLKDDLAAFQRDNGRLRIDRETYCRKRQPSMPGTAANIGGNTTPATGTEADRLGMGEINLDDVASEIGKLGAALDAERARIKYDLLPVIAACERLRSKPK